MPGRTSSLLASVSSFSVAALSTAPAIAHIDLLLPEARAHGTGLDGERDANSNQKLAPCGQLVNGRTERVASYAPGETIQLRVREEINHSSYIRVALDPDGDEFPQRPEARLSPQTDDPGAAELALFANSDSDSVLLAVLNDDNSVSGETLEYQVTLPDIECEACTLQVIQFMYNRSDPYYYQCADLVVRGASDAGVRVEAPDAGSLFGVERAADAGPPLFPKLEDAGASKGSGPIAKPSPGVPAQEPSLAPAPALSRQSELSPEPEAAAEVEVEPRLVAGSGELSGGGCATRRRGAESPGWLGGLAGLALAGLVRRRSAA